MTRDARRLTAIFWRLALFAGAWLVLTGGAGATGPIALTAIALAAATSLWLQPPGTWRWRVAGVVRFVPYFVRQSISGGLDVARRALLPRRPLAPLMIEYDVRLPDGPARRFFAAAIGLLPGTLTAGMRPGGLTVHVLDRSLPVTSMLRELEEHTAALFGVALGDSPHDSPELPP